MFGFGSMEKAPVDPRGLLAQPQCLTAQGGGGPVDLFDRSQLMSIPRSVADVLHPRVTAAMRNTSSWSPGPQLTCGAALAGRAPRTAGPLRAVAWDTGVRLGKPGEAALAQTTNCQSRCGAWLFGAGQTIHPPSPSTSGCRAGGGLRSSGYRTVALPCARPAWPGDRADCRARATA